MGLPQLWGVWEVEFLLLSSLLVQVLLLIFTEWRRRVSRALLSVALNGILWMLYQMADSIALYILGHMSLSSRPHEQQQLMAFWASMLLVHLGGQDTITAYAMEDNDLWLRHLFTLVVQAVGAAYVLYKYVAGGSRALLAAAVLMFLVGVVKYGERIYALYSSGLGSISKFLDGFEVPRNARNVEYPVPPNLDDEEEVLQGAHDLLHICMGQLVDYKVWPSQFQTRAISVYHDRTRTNRNGTTSTTGRSKLLELVGMQLSLMRDILYTKAAVIHTRYGCVSRVVSVVSTIVAFHLFQQSTAVSGRGYSKGDMVVTYILLSGAFSLELVSLLRAAASTWTCAWLRAAGWKQLHAAAVRLRRGVRAADRCRMWSVSIGQIDLLQFCVWGKTGDDCIYQMASCIGLGQQWNRLLCIESITISYDVEDLLLREVQRMVEACGEDEQALRAYRGQLALREWGGASFYDSAGAEEIGFDGSILAWYYATEAFLKHGLYSTLVVRVRRSPLLAADAATQEWAQQSCLVRATHTLSKYMVFLLVERPHLLPSPVRRSQYDSFCAGFVEFRDIKPRDDIADAIRPGVDLATKLIARCQEGTSVAEMLRVISGVWVEMLCYAASHCSSDSHARQLSRSTEFITVAWILTTALFNRFHGDNRPFLVKASRFLERHVKRRMAKAVY
ncbi:uncharacterized protein LOC123439192 [Hordeum vulgare subsp. vulgare]|nr:uncharacterized protein LOC123439192 [Hordeum vulgare subsp. vulgare]